MDIIQKMADPEIIKTLSLGEKLLGSLVVMLIGLGTCFVVLLVIMLCIRVMSKAFGKKAAAEKAPPPAVTPAAPLPAVQPPEPAVLPQPQEEDDAELVAVISAAIAAYEGAGNFRIKSIREKKTTPVLSAWVSAGRAEAFASRSVIKK